MAFKRTLSGTFTTLVTVNVPNDKGGFDKNTFTATFKRPNHDERKALADLSNDDLVRDRLVDWDMRDEDTKEKVPFSPAELDAILQIEPSPLAICEAFWTTVNGAKTKN